MSLFSIAVIGTINRDIIILQTGERSDSLGGILYNTLSLAELANGLVRVFPITFIGTKEKYELFGYLKKHTSIFTSGITEISQGTNTNILRYINDNERKETTEYFTDEIPYSKIESFLSCDILLFNFIAGYDVSIKTLKKIRAHTRAIIFLDVHSMVLKKKNAERAYSTVKNWETWIQFVDIIQMNTQELYYFTGRMFSKEKPTEAILFLLRKGLKMVLITSGETGVYLGYRGGVFFFNQKYSSVVKDTTGCGDIFSSSFLIRYLYTKDPFISCDYANCVSGMATVETGIAKCFLLNKALPALPKFYSRSGNWGSP